MSCKKIPPYKKRIWVLNKRPLRYRLALFTLLFIISAAACRNEPINCEDPLGCVVVRPNTPLHLAALLPMSGDTAVWGQEMLNGIHLALAEQDETLLEHEIELLTLDTACDPATAQQILRPYDNNTDLIGIIGPACSDVATTILPLVRVNDWLMISPTSSLPSLTENQSEMAFFRTVPNHLDQATAAAHFAYEELGIRQAAVFQDETEFNSLLGQQFSDVFTELGGVVSYQAIVEVRQTELTAVLDGVSLTQPELIYVALFEPEANLLITQLAENEQLNQARLLGGDHLFNEMFASQVGENATGMYLTSPIFAGEVYAAFVEQWLARYGEIPTSPTAVYAYDATRLLLAAIEETAIVGQNELVVIGRSALRDHLSQTRDFPAAAGTLNCSATGECAATAYGVYELDTAVLTNSTWPPPLIWQFE